MARINRRWVAAVALLLGGLFGLQGKAEAGPYLGDWGWFWHPARDCERGQYSPCHYWVPEYYEARACLRPTNLDQYPPGPFPPVLPRYEYTKYCCPSTPPAPTSPYANPVGYYGREMPK